jgi:FkbM family methyltransferase
MSITDTDPIPRIIHFTVPDQLDALQEQVIKIARDLHPDWEIKVWSDHVRLEWIERLGDRKLASYYQKATSGAQRADLARVWIVSSEGGVYLDSDIVLRKPLDPLLVLRGKILLCSEDGTNCTNAFFAAPPRHASLEAVMGYLLANEPDWDLPPNETTGPRLFSRILRYRTDTYCLPRETFYPYNHHEPRPARFRPGVIGIHEWAGSWKSGPNLATKAKSAHVSGRSAVQPFLSTGKRLTRKILRRLLPELFPKVAGVSYFNGERVISRHNTGLMIALDPLDQSLTPSLALVGQFEPLEEAFIQSEVRGGDWFLDVGGNIGLMTLLAARQLGPFGRAYYFEPNPIPVACLELSASLNWMKERIVVHQIALSDADGEMHMLGSPDRMGEFRLGGTSDHDSFALYSSRHERLIVEKARLDDIVPFDIPIKFMKIDVEGHEASVLRGARRLLESQSIETVLLEYGTESHGPSFAEFSSELGAMVQFGYSPFRLGLDSEGNINLSPWPKFLSEPPMLGHVPLVMKSSAVE